MSKKKGKSEILQLFDVFEAKVDRRQFVKCSALLGGSLAASHYLARFAAAAQQRGPAWAQLELGDAYVHFKPENQIYSACQQCNTQCGIKVKIVDGLVAKIDGSPYSPWTLTPHIDYQTPLVQAATVEGALCPKGQAGIQTLYDPYRIVKVLKRAGKRGENQWQTVSFEQAVSEIVNGGNLFGEGHVEGLKDIYILRDPKIAKELAEDAALVAHKKMGLAAFKAKHAANLKYLIDPDHPDLGPKNNQFYLLWGRAKHGREDVFKRFAAGAMGSVNVHGHTTVCQGSLYFTCKAMSMQFTEGKWDTGKKFYWQGDTGNAEFILFVGANPYEANYGPPLRCGKITDGIVNQGMKIAVVDPRCSKTAARAWKWLPVRPNGVAAVGMGLMRWIFDHQRYDSRYLANANKAAAKADHEPTWTQATWLVKINKDGTPGPFLRDSNLGLPTQKLAKKDGGEWGFDPFIVSSGGKFKPFDPYSETTPVEGDLLVDTEVKGGKVKSVLQILREATGAKTLAQWAKIAGVEEGDLVALAREFTSHGKRAVADVHRGVSQHTSGFYNVLVYMTLNTLIGNHDWMGGLAKATTYDAGGHKPGKPFDVTKIPGGVKPWGVSMLRHGQAYDQSTIFKGYPAQRPWYPFSSDIYEEAIPSMGDAYPYPIKALFIYMGTPVYSLPAGHKLIEILSDSKKIPLIFASDIVIGETSMYADYIFPDLTYLERWEFPGSHPSVTPKVGPVRQPVSPPLTDAVTVYGQEAPISVESLLLGLAEQLKLPGFGENAFGPGLHFKRDEDLYLRMVANLAFGDKPDGSEKVPAASAEEIQIFEKARHHLPPTIFDAARWKALVGADLWPHVVYVLNRGGRFQGYQQAYKDGQLANKYGKLVGIYFEKFTTTKNTMTGKTYLPHADFVDGPRDVLGRMLDDKAKGFDMTLITYKPIMGCKSRSISDYWLLALCPENFLEISSADARRLNLADGDKAKVVSASNEEGVWDLGPGGNQPMIGRVCVREGMRPGVVAFSLGHGHWAYGSRPVVIDGVEVAADARRGTGVHANAAMRIDPVLKNTGLVDLVGGSAVFYQSQVKLVKV
ncbi:MAG: molybdopterin-dependent oxidoreductase [Thermodesulfobacteriota bacterium]